MKKVFAWLLSFVSVVGLFIAWGFYVSGSEEGIDWVFFSFFLALGIIAKLLALLLSKQMKEGTRSFIARFLISLLILFLTIAVAGFVRFNILQSDIYMETDSGEIIPLKEYEARRANILPDGEGVWIENPVTTNFTGTVESVNTGCFSDRECFVVVDGKPVTAILGWNRGSVGSIMGVDGFGDLQVGQTVEVFARELEDGKYTLYGNEDYYIQVID